MCVPTYGSTALVPLLALAVLNCLDYLLFRFTSVAFSSAASSALPPSSSAAPSQISVVELSRKLLWTFSLSLAPSVSLHLSLFLLLNLQLHGLCQTVKQR